MLSKKPAQQTYVCDDKPSEKSGRNGEQENLWSPLTPSHTVHWPEQRQTHIVMVCAMWLVFLRAHLHLQEKLVRSGWRQGQNHSSGNYSHVKLANSGLIRIDRSQSYWLVRYFSNSVSLTGTSLNVEKEPLNKVWRPGLYWGEKVRVFIHYTTTSECPLKIIAMDLQLNEPQLPPDVIQLLVVP